MTSVLEEINNDALQVHRDVQDRLHGDIDSLRKELFAEKAKHDATQMELTRAVALMVLCYKNISRAGKKGRMVAGEIVAMLNKQMPNRPVTLTTITAQDVEWAEKELTRSIYAPSP